LVVLGNRQCHFGEEAERRYALFSRWIWTVPQPFSNTPEAPMYQCHQACGACTPPGGLQAANIDNFFHLVRQNMSARLFLTRQVDHWTGRSSPLNQGT
jgi:hypothetical protein